MDSSRVFCAFFLATLISPAATIHLGLFNSVGPASQYSTPGTPDYEFVAAGGSQLETFGFEGSFNSGKIRLNALTGAAPGTFTFAVAQNLAMPVWVSGRKYTFTESYSGDATKQVNVQVTDTVTGLSYAIAPYTATFGGVQSLIFRMTAPATSTARPSSSITFEDLSIGGTNFSNVITLNGGAVRNANYFGISGVDFTQAWTLSGAVTLAWTGSTPASNDLTFQIKSWQNPTLANPEPATEFLIGTGLLLCGLVARRG